MSKIKILKITELKCHEQIFESRVIQLMRLISKNGKFIKPIVIEKSSGIILDGHHRVEAMKRLGYAKIPAIQVDYDKINVELRHKNLPSEIIRQLVVLVAMSGQILPKKTTKHNLSLFSPKIRVNLASLN